MGIRLRRVGFPSRAGLALDWGPIPQVARAVAIWRREGLHSQGLWGLIAAKEMNDLWPSNIPPLLGFTWVDAPPEPWWRRALIRVLGWLGIELRRRLPHRDPLPSMLARVVEAQTWLGKRNLRAAAPWFAPFWYDAPTPIGGVTGQGVLWALACRILAEEGPDAYLEQGTLWPLDAAPRPTAADCLSFHLSIEAIVPSVARELGIAALGKPARRPGGLRTDAFLTLWPALALRQDFDAQRWKLALDRLVAASPLTRLVYADLLSNVAAPSTFSGLFYGFSFTGDAIAALAPFRPGSGALGSAWLDLWMSLVARSLVGAVLSPSRLEEAVHEAERNLNEARRKAAGRYPRREPVSSDPEVKAALAELTSLQAQAKAAHAERMNSLPDMVRSNPAFRMRFNDMLVRRIAAERAPEIRQRWNPGDDLDPRAAFFFPSTDGEPRQPICFWGFEAALFGPNRMPTVQVGQSEAWRNRLYAFLAEGDPTPAELAGFSGLPERSAQDLVAQYRRPVVLPFVGMPGHSSQDLVSRWIQILVGRLPAAPEVTEAEVTVEGASAG